MTRLRRNALRLSLFMMIAAIAQASNICESLCHCLELDTEFVIVNCKGYKNHHREINFELFEWPTTENRMIQAFFNNMSIHLLPKISGDSKVVSINFDDNLIRTLPSNPFEYFINLESISLENNLITELTKDFLTSTTKLKTLVLSNNSLSNIDPGTVSHLKELRELDLSHNELTKLSADLIEALSSVEILRMESNKLFTIDNAFNRVDYKFRQLFLAYNQFTVVTGSMFEKFSNLESIDLSNNKITNIDENSFSSLESLKLLDLSFNFIRRVNIKLPDSVQIFTLANNKLITWPLANLPEDLNELELQFNSLEYIFPKDAEVDRLRSLDVSNNIIEHLPNTQFFKLERLDLSYNHLSAVPQSLNSMTPLLRDLILDGNQLTSVYFPDKTTLSSISLNHLPNLERLEAGAFSNLVGIKDSSAGICVDVHVAHNEHLIEIDDAAFEGVELCQLDLSFNQLLTIPMNLTDWSRIPDGIDLQGNPLACNCDDEWMLDAILNKLYNDPNQQFLLRDLKCQSPEDLRDVRFVQFLNHPHPFCGVSSGKKMEKMIHDSSFGGFSLGDENKNIHIELTQGPGFIIIIAMCGIILVAMILVGIRWQRDQDRKLANRNRLYGYDY